VQRHRKTYSTLLITALLSLSACSGEHTPDLGLNTNEDSSLAMRTISNSVKGAFAAAQSPLVDLNIKRDEIPDSLQKTAANPYATPARLQCKILRGEIVELDVMLGPDMQPKDIKKNGGTFSLIDEDADYFQEGANMLQNEAIGFVTGKVSIIPFRGLIRKVTGAEKHSKEVAHAYEAGKLRRAYLKGLSAALKCEKPGKKAKILPLLAANESSQ